jgi:hypothetical protein
MFSFLNPQTLTLPKSSLGYETNNKYKHFPPMMNDGRSLISNWQNETQINHKLIKDNNINSNWKYRQYLTKNAKSVMEYNFRESANDTGYLMPQPHFSNNLNTPYSFNSLNDTSSPFQKSDLKEIYLTREQLNAKKVAPTLNLNCNNKCQNKLIT